MHTPEMPPDLDPPNVPRIRERAIDQAIVDGYVDGNERWVSLGKLTAAAFMDFEVPESVKKAFQNTLPRDTRYIEHQGYRYNYQPTLSPDSTVRPSMRAIMAGTARCTADEYYETLEFMDTVSGEVYQQARGEDTLSRRQIRIILDESGYGAFNYRLGFFRFMSTSSDFYLPGDGRHILTRNYAGSTEELSPLERIDDLSPLVEAALPDICADEQGVFTIHAALGTVKFQGTYLRSDQLYELSDAFAAHPEVELLHDGRFRRLTESRESDPGPSTGLSLDDPDLDRMVYQSIGAMAKKPDSPMQKRSVDRQSPRGTR